MQTAWLFGKLARGFNVTVNAQSNWNASSVRTAILNAYNTWDPPLEFVVLMGDPGASWGIPVSGSNFDHSYASLTTGDELEDVGVGRLSGGDATALGTINAKIMQYERVPHMETAGGQADTTWFHKAFLYAGVARGCAGNLLLMRWAKDQFAHNTGVTNSTVSFHTSDNVNTTEVQNQVNGGVSFFLWRGSWINGMPSNIADGTNPGGRFPITMTITCNAGDYTGSGISGPAEDWLCAGTIQNPKGGVCGMGTSTSGTQNGANVILAGGMIHNVADLKVEHLGTATAGAKAMLYYAYGPSHQDPEGGGSIALHFTQYFNLLGDPSLSIWTDVPILMNAMHTSTLNVGARSFSVDVLRNDNGTPVADALVVLWKGTETFSRVLTDAEGHAEIPITINTAGDLLLTITKRGHKPYLRTISCVPVDQMITYNSCTLDDDNVQGTQGNANGQLNPGETIDLPIYLKNFGTTGTASNISATLTSNNPHIVVVTGTSSYPNIAPGDSAVPATNFRISVSPVMQQDEIALLSLAVNSSSAQSNSSFILTCKAGKLDYISQSLSGTLNPGDTRSLSVTLKNDGILDMVGVTAQLISLSPFVSVDVAQGTFGTINIGQTATNNSSQFTLTANTLTFRGHQANMMLIASTTAGFLDTVTFTVNVGTATATDPTGPRCLRILCLR